MSLEICRSLTAIESLAGMAVEGVDDLEIAIAGRGGVLAAEELVVQTLPQVRYGQSLQ